MRKKIIFLYECDKSVLLLDKHSNFKKIINLFIVWESSKRIDTTLNIRNRKTINNQLCNTNAVQNDLSIN